MSLPVQDDRPRTMASSRTILWPYGIKIIAGTLSATRLFCPGMLRPLLGTQPRTLLMQRGGERRNGQTHSGGRRA